MLKAADISDFSKRLDIPGQFYYDYQC